MPRWAAAAGEKPNDPVFTFHASACRGRRGIVSCCRAATRCLVVSLGTGRPVTEIQMNDGAAHSAFSPPSGHCSRDLLVSLSPPERFQKGSSSNCCYATPGESPYTFVVADDPAHVTSVPVISGRAQVPYTLSTDPGVWGPGAVDLSYQKTIRSLTGWPLEARPTGGATDPTYQLKYGGGRKQAHTPRRRHLA